MAKLVSNLSKIAQMAPEAAGRALLKTAADVVDIVKQIVPVDTGALKQSYGAVPVSSSEVHIGSDKIYAPIVEFGGVNQTAQPSLTIAMNEAEGIFKVRLKEEMEKIAK